MASLAAALLLAAVGLPLLLRANRAASVLEESVNDHIGFLAGRLPLEIASPDEGEVASWFEGKVDFPVRVLRFSDGETTLLGGRLCRLKGTDVAYLTYKRSGHTLSLFVFDCTGIRFPKSKKVTRDGRGFYITELKGYTLIRWGDKNIACIAVSDIDGEKTVELVSNARPSSSSS